MDRSKRGDYQKLIDRSEQQKEEKRVREEEKRAREEEKRAREEAGKTREQRERERLDKLRMFQGKGGVGYGRYGRW